jgi:hypothetical protein
MSTIDLKSLKAAAGEGGNATGKLALLNFLEPIGYLQSQAEDLGNFQLADSLQKCVDIIYETILPGGSHGIR